MQDNSKKQLRFVRIKYMYPKINLEYNFFKDLNNLVQFNGNQLE
jgi:hypothetical protein